MEESEQLEIAARLTDASAAHNEYEQRKLGGVYDQGWATWYAAYLVEHGLGNLLGETLAEGTLAGLLAQYDQDYRARQRQEGWPDYYAAQLLAWRAARQNQPAS